MATTAIPNTQWYKVAIISPATPNEREAGKTDVALVPPTDVLAINEVAAIARISIEHATSIQASGRSLDVLQVVVSPFQRAVL